MPGLRKLVAELIAQPLSLPIPESLLSGQSVAKLPIIVITGPTAGGKTALALAIADQFSCQLISVDSSMVYRQMNIGTAKPNAEVLQRYPHSLVNIRDLDQPYSAGDFVEDAREAIALAMAKGKIPVLVGGTLLYLRALFRGLAAMPPANAQMRLELETEAARDGWHSLHDELFRVDPAAAKKIAPADRQRIQRALEVYRLTNRPISDWQRESSAGPDETVPLTFILAPRERQKLHTRIARRSAQMVDSGLIDEVVALREQGQIDDLPAMRAVGYRQVVDCLCGRIDRSALVERITIATRQLAKRQLTWLRSDPGGVWLDSEAESTTGRICRQVAGAMDQ